MIKNLLYCKRWKAGLGLGMRLKNLPQNMTVLCFMLQLIATLHSGERITGLVYLLLYHVCVVACLSLLDLQTTSYLVNQIVKFAAP